MNPYQHSDVAATIYEFLCKDPVTEYGEQGALGSLACRLAILMNKNYDVELQPHEMAP